MVLENIFIGSVGWTGFEFNLWKIWLFFSFKDVSLSLWWWHSHYSALYRCHGLWSSFAEERLSEQQLHPKPPPPTQVWDQCLATQCFLCNGSCPSCIWGGGSKLCLAFSNTVNNRCQDESLAVIYCSPIFEAPSVISFITDDGFWVLVCASFVFTSWMNSLLLCLNFFNEWLLLRKLDLKSERNSPKSKNSSNNWCHC